MSTTVPLSGFLSDKVSPVSLFLNLLASTIEVVLSNLKYTKHNLGRVHVVLVVSLKDMFAIAMSVETDLKILSFVLYIVATVYFYSIKINLKRLF